MRTKRYSEVIRLATFEERYEYLKLNGVVGDMTFNGHRYLNQLLYRCPEWKQVRNRIIVRDAGCDLAMSDRPIGSKLLVHHINPITAADIIEREKCVFDPENLICVSMNTHNAIHYGDSSLLVKGPVVRTKHDTCPWR